MSQWYYAEGNRERRGPLPAEDIAGLFRSGRIAADTLLWREGAGDWRPLRDFAAELGLDEAPATQTPAATPPLPPPMRHAAVATPATSTAPPPKPGLSGCALTAIIGAAALVVLVPVLAILAAIALPAYQQYVVRSQVVMAQARLLPLKSEVAAFAQANDRCPDNGEDGFGTPESYAGDTLASVRIGYFEEDHCGIEARLRLPKHAELDGKAIWLDYDMATATWQCSSEAADKYLPADCRG